ncbi:MAG: general secretion pathway protein GspK [Polyangiales bacterium]
MRRRRKDQRGVALLLVMSSIALLTITLVEFQEEQTSDLQSAYAERDALVAEYMARSGMNLSRLFIAAEPTMRNSLGILKLMFKGGNVPQLPVWEFSDVILGAFSDKAGQKGFGDLGGFDLSKTKHLGGPEGARFTVTVVDEDSKINANLGARGNVIAENRFGQAFLGLTASPAYDALFQRNDRDGNTTDRETMCGAIMDWADPDEILYPCQPFNFQGGGAAAGGEDQSTQLLPKPYRVKNAAYDSLDELRLVRGVGDDFWATFVDPDPSSPKKRVLTVWGQGPLNVNTASPQAVLGVLCGLAHDSVICTDPMKSQSFLSMFGVLRTFTAGMPLFGSPMEFVTTAQGGGNYGKLLFDTLKIPPVKFQSPAEAAKNFTTESKVFSIYATGEVDGPHRTTRVKLHVVVDFRGAPGIPDMLGANGQPAGASSAPGSPPGAPTTAPTTSPTSTLPGGLTPDALAAALAVSPEGAIVHYRVE